MGKDHIYIITDNKLPFHLEYADDIYFIMPDDYDRKILLISIKNIINDINLSINQNKTQYSLMPEGQDLKKVRKLGFVPNDFADIESRDNFCQVVLNKNVSLKKNPYM